MRCNSDFTDLDGTKGQRGQIYWRESDQMAMIFCCEGILKEKSDRVNPSGISARLLNAVVSL